MFFRAIGPLVDARTGHRPARCGRLLAAHAARPPHRTGASELCIEAAHRPTNTAYTAYTAYPAQPAYPACPAYLASPISAYSAYPVYPASAPLRWAPIAYFPTCRLQEERHSCHRA